MRSPDAAGRASLDATSVEGHITVDPSWLIVRWSAPHDVVSWAITGGGARKTSVVAWHRISEAELRPPVDARRLLEERLRAAGAAGAVGLLTSRRLDAYVDVTRAHGPVQARCVATVGLGNALRAGDPPGPAARLGTINLLCRVSVPLGFEALLEALALASEARALAVREAHVTSTVSGAPASGTGTDCIVVAAPAGSRGLRYAGKHTVAGHVIGNAVHAAIAQGAEAWKCERGGSAQ